MLAAVVFLSATTLSASPIFGTFNFAGAITVIDNTNIQWSLTTPNDQLGVVVPTESGSFVAPPLPSTLVGQMIGVLDLTNPPNIVDGAGFPDQTFITFPAAFGLPNLDINFIAAGAVSPSSNCLATPPAAGQSCTAPGSPFFFINTTTSGVLGSTASFSFSGVTADGLSTWTGVFTSNFNVPWQTVFATLASPPHTITNSYSATINVTPIPEVPEPNTAVLLGLGGLGVFVGCLRKKRRIAS